MNVLRLLPAILSLVVMTAHFMRSQNGPFVLLTLTALWLLLVPRRWAMRIVQILLVLGSVEWVATALVLYRDRVAADRPWLRMVIILSAVALVALLGALMFQGRALKARYRARPRD